jgi:hypothetical protein
LGRAVAASDVEGDPVLAQSGTDRRQRFLTDEEVEPKVVRELDRHRLVEGERPLVVKKVVLGGEGPEVTSVVR